MKPAIPGSRMPGPVGVGCGKDSQWLTLEVCREYARNKCTRTDEECRFAHPPSNVEVQNGRVTCCFDSIKGRCQRTDPPCKYLHPPQHLKEQLLQNGRNNLLLKNLQWQNMSTPGIHSIVPAATVYPMANGYLIGVQQSPGTYAPYYSQQMNGLVPTGLMPAVDQTNGNGPAISSTMVPALPAPSEQPSQPQSTSNGNSSEMAYPANGSPRTCENVTTGPPYWHSLTPSSPLTSAYVVDNHTGTTYYSPAAFFQGLGAHNGLVPMMKGSHQTETLKNGVTVYTACAPNPSAPGASYLPLALSSFQSCYQPMSMCSTTTMGPSLMPPPVAVAPVQRY